jgi:hypothetical protein
VAGSSSSKRPAIALGRRGTRARLGFTVQCDSACAGTAKLTVTRKLAKRLHLGRRRTIGTLRFRLTGAGRKRFMIRLSKAALRGERRAGVRRVATRISVTATDLEQQRRARRAPASIRR